jgi:hypothetical protein
MLIEIVGWNNPRAAYGTQWVLKRFNDQWFVVGARSSWVAEGIRNFVCGA